MHAQKLFIYVESRRSFIKQKISFSNFFNLAQDTTSILESQCLFMGVRIQFEDDSFLVSYFNIFLVT